MVGRRTEMIIGFLILLSPVTALQVGQAVGLNDTSTQVKSDETTLTYTSANMETYFGSSEGTTIADAPASFPQRVIGFMAPKGKCSVYSLPVTVTSGTLLRVQMTANHPVNFYLFSDHAAGGWSNECNISGDTVLTINNFTDYTLRWIAPENGTFYFVFTGPTAVILLTDVGSVKPAGQTATITYPTSTKTSLRIHSSTATASSTITMTTPLYMQATSPDRVFVVALILTLLAALLLALFKRDSFRS